LIPNIVVSAPKDESELRDLLYTAVEYPGPFAIRFPKGKGYGVELKQGFNKLEVGRSEILEKGEEILILAIGSMVYPAVKATEILKNEGIFPTVVNIRFLKPLDVPLLEDLFSTHKYIITIEENIITGGLFSAISELLNILQINRILVPIALPEKFIEQGSAELLKDIYNLTESKIAKKILGVFENIKVKG
ncbi:MAG: transketolase C-terminal domain-containing protein, partial [Dictyoglomus sp.]